MKKFTLTEQRPFLRSKYMRRVVIICLLVAAVAMPALASDVALSGWARYGVIVDSSTGAWKDAEYARMYAKFTVDDYTFAELRFFNAAQGLVTAVDFTADSTTDKTIEYTYLYYGYISSNIAGYLGLADQGIDITLKAGRSDHSDSSFDSITAYGLSAGAAAQSVDWQLLGTIGISGIANIELGVDPLGTNNFYFNANTSQSIGPGTVNFEVSYDGNSAAGIGEGLFATTGNYDMTMMDLGLKVGVGLNYNLGSSAMVYHFGVKGSYGSIGNVAAKLVGNDGGLDMLAISAEVDPITNVAVLAAAKLNISGTGDMFTGADVAAKFDVGPTDIYLGYLITSSGGGNNWAPAATDNGGLYLKIDLSY